MSFRRCGNSGLKLSAVSLGAWETLGGYVGPELARACIFTAFNLGITHFDLANTYGTPAGRSEIIVGRTLREMPREEIVVSTKAGRSMWPGPYGEGSSRKVLFTGIDQSLKRLGFDYVDIFYSHRPDPDTPLEETLRALDQIVRDGKALYVGLSGYPAALLSEACRLAQEMELAPIITAHVRYNMLSREPEQEMLAAARQSGAGVVAYSALAQGLLTSRYLSGVPEGSRAARSWTSAQRDGIGAVRGKLQQLHEIAQARGQTLAQMAIAWTLRFPEVASALTGASDIEHLEENVKALENLNFSEGEISRIDAVLQSAASS
ncbi:MAG: aldo/keto reductase [Verrucomicrobiota bacterium]|nr:aldo/keto reductase [Verrucomicrobiota bacterium]